MTAASLAGRALAARKPRCPDRMDRFWPRQHAVLRHDLDVEKLGTFEENLDRVALAGYHHVELVGEFKKWSEEDYKRIMARMETLKISVDATSGVSAGLCGSLGRGCVSRGAEGAHSRRQAIAVQADHSALG